MADQREDTPTDAPAPAPDDPRSQSPEPEEVADANIDGAPASDMTGGPSQARGWWQEAAHTTKAWAKLIAALDLATEKAAAFIVAKPVETALWHYDERFLQPRLEQEASYIAAKAQGIPGPRRPRHQSTNHESLIHYVIPVGSASYTEPKSVALWEDHFWGVEARLRTQRFRGCNQDVHASLAAWRILRWLLTPEAAALGLDHLFVHETTREQWGQGHRVAGVMLEYLYDFEAETSV
ncbi:hypothetical protein PG996_003843 [Apiospora saccharicola]|uniref:Uncharacterized protein n=1 Tax=Apiospora saccharicola TaxID=335842 RepID=A0ABR1W6A3_9PEZI